ncbi:MAG: cysteine desulfurase family protein [Candidatus Zambryskibacteria bacterium]
MSKRRIYLDHAGTTALDPRVFSVMLPYFKKEFGNPSNLYSLSRRAKDAIDKSSQTIAGILNCRPDEIFYTGSATEADNLAIFGVARGSQSRTFGTGAVQSPTLASKIIVSQIEHKGILAVCDVLEKEACPNDSVGRGFEIVKLPVRKNGLIDLDEFKKELNEKTILVSITYADSETGTIQPISEISKIIKEFKKSSPLAPLLAKERGWGEVPYFHTDASQVAGYMDIDMNKLGVDMMTISSHKIYGPKGVGALYVKRGTKISPIIFGGGQQGNLRSGTENVPGIVGFAKALELIRKESKKESARIKKMRDTLEKGIFKSIPKIVLNGHPDKRLPGFLNVSILDVEGEAMLLYLDELGIMVSTGSACNSQSLEPSYILTALGRPYEHIHGSIRFTLGRENTIQDIKYVLKHLPKVVQILRNISPLDVSLNQRKKISDPRAFVGGQTLHFLRKNNPPSLKATARQAKK